MAPKRADKMNEEKEEDEDDEDEDLKRRNQFESRMDSQMAGHESRTGVLILRQIKTRRL